jgi:hypothetical protein
MPLDEFKLIDVRLERTVKVGRVWVVELFKVERWCVKIHYQAMIATYLE